MFKKIKQNQELIVSFLVFLNFILLIILLFKTYYDYPAMNSLTNKLIGIVYVSLGQLILIDISLFLFFLIVIYAPYCAVKFISHLSNKQYFKDIKKLKK